MFKVVFLVLCSVSVTSAFGSKCHEQVNEAACNVYKYFGIGCNWCPVTGSCHTKGSVKNPCKGIGATCGGITNTDDCQAKEVLSIKACLWCYDTNTCHMKGSKENECKSWTPQCATNKEENVCNSDKYMGLPACNWCTGTSTCHAEGSFYNECKGVGSICSDNHGPFSCKYDKLCRWCEATESCHLYGSTGKGGNDCTSWLNNCDEETSKETCAAKSTTLGPAACNWCDDTSTCHAKGSFFNECKGVATVCGENKDEHTCEADRSWSTLWTECQWCDDTDTCHIMGSPMNACKSWVDCADHTNIYSCLGAKGKAGVLHTCNWCIETSSCHAWGSVVDKCSKECCVSKKLLGQCSSTESNPEYCYPAPGNQTLDIQIIFDDDSLSTEEQDEFMRQRRAAMCFLKGALGKGNFQVKIYTRAANIDGEGGVLGHAGPDQTVFDTRNGYTRTLTGIMEFDKPDIARMMQQGTFGDVILHEMLHVLGHGTLWADNGCAGKDKDCGNASTYWKGDYCPLAHKEYLAMGGKGDIPLADTGGAGTRCAHWKESVFKDEVGTGFASNAPFAPLSSMTVQAFADIGFVVDPECVRVSPNEKVDLSTLAARPEATVSYAGMTGLVSPTGLVETDEEFWKARDGIVIVEDVGGTDEPGTDVGGTDEPGTDVGGTDEPGTAVGGTGKAGTDTPDVDGTGDAGTGTGAGNTDEEERMTISAGHPVSPLSLAHAVAAILCAFTLAN